MFVTLFAALAACGVKIIIYVYLQVLEQAIRFLWLCVNIVLLLLIENRLVTVRSRCRVSIHKIVCKDSHFAEISRDFKANVYARLHKKTKNCPP